MSKSMEYQWIFRLLDGLDPNTVCDELKKQGLKDLFIIEEDSEGTVLIGGHSSKEIQTENALLVEKKPAVVDWESQWACFAEGFEEGKAHIQLGEKTLLLLPGPGFGDLSHPTTFLMLEMIKEQVKNESVIDIGSGSGILTLASLLLGASSAVGIEIDEQAITHAKANAKLNNLSASFGKKVPKKNSSVFLMNMIFPEQKQVRPQQYNRFAKRWIISGILTEQREEYLNYAKNWGWILVDEKEKSGWIGLQFSVLGHQRAIGSKIREINF